MTFLSPYLESGVHPRAVPLIHSLTEPFPFYYVAVYAIHPSFPVLLASVLVQPDIICLFFQPLAVFSSVLLITSPNMFNFLLETSIDFLLPGEKKKLAPWAIDQCSWKESMFTQKMKVQILKILVGINCIGCKALFLFYLIFIETCVEDITVPTLQVRTLRLKDVK